MMTQAADWMKNSHTTLDVRPELAAGGEPFVSIMEAATKIPEGEALVIVAPFEPVPLYGALGEHGFSYETEKVAAEEWVVRFRKNIH